MLAGFNGGIEGDELVGGRLGGEEEEEEEAAFGLRGGIFFLQDERGRRGSCGVGGARDGGLSGRGAEDGAVLGVWCGFVLWIRNPWEGGLGGISWGRPDVDRVFSLSGDREFRRRESE